MSASSPWSASVPLLEGDAGTAQTIALIRAAIADGLRDPVIRAVAGGIVREYNPADQTAHARAIFDFVRSRIRFVRDPVGHETVSSARWTLSNGFGDCDDINAVLLPALLGVVGVHTRLVTIALDPRDPQAFTHIYCEALLNGQWIPIDAARPNPRFGETSRQPSRRQVWEIEDGRGGLAGELASPADWIAPITQGATQIIAALRAPNYALTPALYAGGGGGLYAAGGARAGSFPGGYDASGGLVSNLNPMWIVAGGVGLLLLFGLGGRR